MDVGMLPRCFGTTYCNKLKQWGLQTQQRPIGPKYAAGLGVIMADTTRPRRAATRTGSCRFRCNYFNMRSSQQTYIQKLGFCDKDRTNPRHQQACEYLLERVWTTSNEEEARAYKGEDINVNDRYYVEGLGCFKPHPRPASAECISVPIRSRYSVCGFADVLWHNILGEVKITPEPAEVVLQQINFYLQFLDWSVIYGRSKVIVLVDYDAPALKRLTNDSQIAVYRLGDRFARWQDQLTRTTVEEL